MTLLDLDVTYAGDIKDGELINVRQEPGDFRPQVRVVCTSDDLIALTDGSLNFAHAWATGRCASTRACATCCACARWPEDPPAAG